MNSTVFSQHNVRSSGSSTTRPIVWWNLRKKPRDIFILGFTFGHDILIHKNNERLITMIGQISRLQLPFEWKHTATPATIAESRLPVIKVNWSDVVWLISALVLVCPLRRLNWPLLSNPRTKIGNCPKSMNALIWRRNG